MTHPPLPTNSRAWLTRGWAETVRAEMGQDEMGRADMGKMPATQSRKFEINQIKRGFRLFLL